MNSSPVGLRGMRVWGVLPVLLLLMCGEGHAETHNAITKHCFHEPIFEQQLCLYEANPEATTTVLFVHGLNGDALRDWKPQLQALSASFHVVALELPGFRTMARDHSLYSAHHYARVLHSVVTRYAHGPLYLVGHSMGGVVSLHYVIDYPASVAKLVLVDVAGLLHRIAYSRELLNGWLEKEGVEDSDAFSVAADKIAIKLLIGLDSYADEIAAQHSTDGQEWFQDDPVATAAFNLLNEDLSGTLEAISQPVLLLWGAEDRIAPLRTAYLLEERLQHSRLHLIPGAGHMPMLSYSAAFNRELVAFLEGNNNIPEHWALPAPALRTTPREGTCDGEAGKVFEGSYTRIVLRGCQHAVLRDVTAQSVVAQSSRFEILHSDIGGGEVALTATGSDVRITASRLSGERAIHASGSRLDMAGVDLVATHQAVTGDRRSQLIFSLCDIQSPTWKGPIHAYLEVERDKPL